MVDVPKVEAHNVPEVEASSRPQRVKRLMVAKFAIYKSYIEIYSISCVETIRSACSLKVELMNFEEDWDSEVILDGAKIVGCNGSTSRDVTPKGTCE
jgi:hypothetical protein